MLDSTCLKAWKQTRLMQVAQIGQDSVAFLNNKMEFMEDGTALFNVSLLKGLHYFRS